MPIIRFSQSNSSSERQQTVVDVQLWLNAKETLSPMKRQVVQVALNFAGQDDFIHINRFLNLFVNRDEFNLLGELLTWAMQPEFTGQSDLQLLLFMAQALKKLSSSSNLKAALIESAVSNARINEPLTLPLQESLIPLYQVISQQAVTKKLQDFQTSLNTLQQQDYNIAIGAALIGSVCFLGLSYFIKVPATLLILGCAAPYACPIVKNREAAAKEQQGHLKALVVAYKALTQNGFRDTHNPLVLQILRVIAPYASTQELCHWRNLSGVSVASAIDAPHPEFLDILSKPPHYLAYTRQRVLESDDEVKDRLQVKLHIMDKRYSFWQKVYGEVLREIYGTDSTPESLRLK